MQARDTQKEAESGLIVKTKRPGRSARKGLSAISVSRLESRRISSRNEDRHRLETRRGKVKFRGREHAVEVVNVSEGGAMVVAEFAPNLNERVDLHLGIGAPLQCLVRWIKEGRVGLEFAHETQLNCSDSERTALLRKVVETDLRDKQALQVDVVSSAGSPEHRLDGRHPLIWFGELMYGSHRWEVRLRDISATGALVECSEPLLVGSQVLLDLGKAGSLTANVTWAVGDQAGLNFHEPFDMRCLSQTRPQVAPVEWLRPAYLENGASSPVEKDGWDRLSLEQLRDELEGFLKR